MAALLPALRPWGSGFGPPGRARGMDGGRKGGPGGQGKRGGWMDGWNGTRRSRGRRNFDKERGVSAEGRRRGAAAQVSRPTACARGIKSVRSHRVCLCARVGAFVFVHGCVFVCVRARERARGRQMTAGTTRRTPRRSRNGQLLSQSATKAEPEGRPARRRRRRPAPLNPLEIVSPRTPPSRSAARASCWVSFNIR